MTRYDPFAKSPAKTDATRVAPPRHEEDMLFATGEPVKGGPPADSSWELLNADIDNLLPNAGTLRDAELFAAEILGEETPAPARTQPKPATESAAPQTPKPTQAQKQVTPAPRAAAAPPPQTPKPTQTQKQVTPAPRAAAAPTPAVRTLPAPASPRVAVRTLPTADAPAPTEARARTTLDPIGPTRPARQRSGARRHAPAIVFGVGASVAGCLALIQHNYVLAAIVGAATLVGVLFAWLLNRG